MSKKHFIARSAFILFIAQSAFILSLQAQDTAYYRLPIDSSMTLSLAGNFGEPRENHFHSGVDFRVGGQPGAKLYAVADGYISRISVSSGGYGKAVYINHPNGTTSVYAHLHAFPPEVKKYIARIQYKKKRFTVNEWLDASLFPVKKGQVIGIAGNSGNSFGAHLHFELRETAGDKTLNMIKQGVYRMPDDIPPKFHNIVFYEYRKSSGVPDVSPCFAYAPGSMAKKNPVMVPDTFFVAVDVDDRQNGTSGVLGVNRLIVKLDGEEIFSYRMDGFLFEDTKYINSLMAYDWWVTQKRPTIKTWLEPGNKLLYIYDKVVNNGLLTLPDSTVHALEITAYDDVGNASLMTFNIRKSTVDSSQYAVGSSQYAVDSNQHAVGSSQYAVDSSQYAVGSSQYAVDSSQYAVDSNQHAVFTADCRLPTANCRRPMFPDSVNVFREQGLQVTVPAGALYRPIWFASDTLPRPDGSCSDYWRIHTAEVPLHHAAQVHLSAVVPAHLQSKAIVVKCNSKGKISSSGGTWTDNGVSASIYSFGDYFVTLDTVPPLIEPKFVRQANVKKHEKLSVKITDDMSGISSYSAMIDGKWALMEYDAKENMLEYFFNPDYIKRNQTHTLVVTVMDKRLNMSTLETQFIW